MRLIDADALSKLVGEPIEVFLRRLDLKLPPTVEAVEVVRCKDCRWFENDGYHTNCQIMRFCVEAEDYCSRGERREDETN